MKRKKKRDKLRMDANLILDPQQGSFYLILLPKKKKYVRRKDKG